jgi:hypothetical protein
LGACWACFGRVLGVFWVFIGCFLMLLNKIALQKFCCRGCRVSSLVPGLVYRYSSPSAYIYTVCLQGKQSGQSARIPYLSKSDEIGTEAKLDEIEGQK